MNQEPLWKEFAEDVPEYVIPDRWTPEHVLHRMIHACNVVHRLPMKRPGAVKSAWPAYVYEWADVLGWEELSPAEKAERQRDVVDTRLAPNSIDVSMAEEAVLWPCRYLISGPSIQWMYGNQISIVRWATRRARASDQGGEPIVAVVQQAKTISKGLINDLVVVR